MRKLKFRQAIGLGLILGSKFYVLRKTATCSHSADEDTVLASITVESFP